MQAKMVESKYQNKKKKKKKWNKRKYSRNLAHDSLRENVLTPKMQGEKFTYDTLKNNFTYLIESNRIELNWIDQRKDVLHRLVIYSYNFISNDYRNEKHQR